MELDDELLRHYAEAKSEDAFAELVRRHLDLVYSAALRQVNGDAHLAQDVAQTVFTELARQAAVLSRRQTVTGWLYTCAQFAAAKAVRKEQRRHRHELEAKLMHELLHAAPLELNWEKLCPVLDKVMHELKESDRDAILIRYFENRSLADVGARLGVSEEAARKRVDRALEKLRVFLFKRGFQTTAGLAAVLSANAVQLAPIGLAGKFTSTSIGGAAAASGTTINLLKLATMTKLQVGIISIIVAGVATPLLMQHQSNAKRGLKPVSELRNMGIATPESTFKPGTGPRPIATPRCWQARSRWKGMPKHALKLSWRRYPNPSALASARPKNWWRRCK